MAQGLKDTLVKTLNALDDRLDPPDKFRFQVGPKPKHLRLSSDVHLRMAVDNDSKWETRRAYRSVFMTLKFRNARFPFTGDAYTEYEDHMLAVLAMGQEQQDVLKITHHGSEHGTSKKFADAVQPLIAVASTNKDGGHNLEQAVRKRLGTNCKIYDTYKAKGDIRIRTDGKLRQLGGASGILYEVEQFSPGRLRPFI